MFIVAKLNDSLDVLEQHLQRTVASTVKELESRVLSLLGTKVGAEQFEAVRQKVDSDVERSALDAVSRWIGLRAAKDDLVVLKGRVDALSEQVRLGCRRWWPLAQLGLVGQCAPRLLSEGVFGRAAAFPALWQSSGRSAWVADVDLLRRPRSLPRPRAAAPADGPGFGSEVDELLEAPGDEGGRARHRSMSPLLASRTKLESHGRSHGRSGGNVQPAVCGIRASARGRARSSLP